MSGVKFWRVIVPAPPCMTNMIFGACARAMMGMNATSAIARFMVAHSKSRRQRAEGRSWYYVLPSAFCLLLSASVYAQGPAADWRTITTPHFRIHYPAEYEGWARRAAARIESGRQAGVREGGFSPQQTPHVALRHPIAGSKRGPPP